MQTELAQNRAISDLYLISALVAYGLRPLRVDRTNPKRQKFIFDNEKLVDTFVFSDGTLRPLALTVEEIETYFLSDKLFFPGNYPKTLREIRANIHGYREDLDYDN